MSPQPSTKKRLSPTVTYLITALAVGIPNTIAVASALPLWHRQNTLAPISLAAIHITILGFMLTVMYGVLYQIVPIAFQAPSLPRHVYTWHLPIHLLSVTGMAYGFFRGNMAMVGTAGSLLIAAAIAFFVFVGRSYNAARNQTFVHRQLIWPVLALAAVFGLGLFQAFSPRQITIHILLSHVLLGGLGFWGGLVLVISYKLIPMFALSHGYKARLPLVASFYFGAVGMDVVGQITGVFLMTVVGLLGLAVALIGFIGDMLRILRARKRKRIAIPLKEALLALSLTIVGQSWLLLAWGFGNVQEAINGGFVFVFAGLIPMMLAYMQKIVPFLWFEYRFSKSRDRKSAPLIDDMVPKVPAAAGMLLFYAASTCGTVSLLLKTSMGQSSSLEDLLRCGFAIFTSISLLLFIYAFTKVITLGGTRPADDVPQVQH